MMGGISVNRTGDRIPRRRAGSLWRRCSFVLGLSTVFLFVGLSVSALGRGMAEARYLAVFGAGRGVLVFRADFLHRFFRIRCWTARPGSMPASGRIGLLAPMFWALAFAFGWTPCIGPILGRDQVRVVIARRRYRRRGGDCWACIRPGLAALPAWRPAYFSAASRGVMGG